jgi:HSP20 family molecular chaperone IbpA
MFLSGFQSRVVHLFATWQFSRDMPRGIFAGDAAFFLVVLLTISIPFAITSTSIKSTRSNQINKMRFSAVTLIPLLAAMSAEGHPYEGTLAPRAYRFNRLQDPFDLVSDIFSMPVYVNSLMRHQQKELSRHSPSHSHSTTPSYAVSEDPKTGMIELTLEIPGVLPNDISVELEDNKLLRVKGSRTLKQHGSLAEYQFDQVFQLDDDVDPERLKVSLSSGILRITAPKKEKVIKRLPVDTVDADAITLEAKAVTDEVKEETDDGKNEVQEITIDGMTISEE